MALQTGNDPSALLTTALEKLLYLESRLDSSEAARAETARDVERQRLAAQAARQALADWQRRTTDAEVAAEGAEREVAVLRNALAQERQARNASARESELQAELASMEELLARYKRERETWLDRMVTLQRIDSGGEELDLGSFIAEMRAENLAARRGDTGRPRITVGERPAAPDPQALLAEIPSSEIDPDELIRNARLPRGERTLATLCARDLRSDSAAVRRRAAERLIEGHVSALAPLVASLLGKEPEVPVRITFVRLIAQSESESAALSLRQAMGDADPRVRAAALDALAEKPQADLSGALHDGSAAIRRRALGHLPPRSSAAVDPLMEALRDDDPSVRHVAALSLAALSGSEVDAALQNAAQSADPEVREVAVRSLARRGLAVRAAPAPPGRAVPAASEFPEPSSQPAPDTARVDAQVFEDVRSSLRGRSLEELSASLRLDLEAVEAAGKRLIAARRLVRRGRKLYQR